MSDLLHLLWVLAAIYGLECLVWLRLGSVALVSWTGRKWRVQHPGQLAGNARGGFVFAQPLPPLGLCLCSAQWPVSLAPQGACAYHPGVINQNRRPLHGAKTVRFDEVKHFRHLGKAIWVDGRKWCAAASEAQAAWLAKKLEYLRRLPLEDRAAAIHSLMEDTLDDTALEQRRAEWQKEMSTLRLSANALFVSTFAVSPLCVGFLGLKQTGWILLALLVIQMFFITWRYFKAHKRLLPEASEDRFNWTLTMVLALPAAMRAHDLLGRQAFFQFHPAAMAKAFCSAEKARGFAGMILRDLRFPLQFPPGGIGSKAVDILICHQKTWDLVFAGWLKKSGWDEQTLLAAPDKTDPEDQAYCPRCLALYAAPKEGCHECGGDQLLPLK